MPRNVARHAFRNLPSLMNKLDYGTSAPELNEILRVGGKRSPNVKMVQLIVYKARLISPSMARNILEAMKNVDREKGIRFNDNDLSFESAIIEFDSTVEGLGYHIKQAEQNLSDPENAPARELSAMLDCTEDVIIQCISGKNRLVPFEFAERLSVAATTALKLSQPLPINRLEANDTTYKPIGAETTKEPHKCERSIALRKDVINWHQNCA